jgi:hypothetical protein
MWCLHTCPCSRVCYSHYKENKSEMTKFWHKTIKIDNTHVFTVYICQFTRFLSNKFRECRRLRGFFYSEMYCPSRIFKNYGIMGLTAHYQNMGTLLKVEFQTSFRHRIIRFFRKLWTKKSWEISLSLTSKNPFQIWILQSKVIEFCP